MNDDEDDGCDVLRLCCDVMLSVMLCSDVVLCYDVVYDDFKLFWVFGD